MSDSPGLSADLREVVRLAADPDGLDDLLRRGLDWLGRVVPYELATVFVLEPGGRLVVRAARGPLANAAVLRHVIELARFPSLRESLETRRARALTEHDHAGDEGDPFDGVLDLPHGHSCMVVPLCTGESCFGVLSLDRSVCGAYPRETVELAEVYGQLLAMAIRHARQREVLAALADRERARLAILEDGLSEEAVGLLDESHSPAMRRVAHQARQVATTDTPVLLLGETGTGKERLARAVHAWSPRRNGPFVTVNCAAIPATLIESELFGHVRGAFTGAARDRSGRFQAAAGGTLLLDEVGELPLDLQAKLLRVLQERVVQPVGADRDRPVDVRVLAATHVDLEAAVRQGRFREDLYYRLAVFPIVLPPLRERLEDLPRLCEVLLAAQGRRTGRVGLSVRDDGLARLARHGWPGNIRELANVLERAAILAPTPLDRAPPPLGAEAFDVGGPALAHAPVGGLVSLQEAEAAHIRRVLAHTEGRVYGAGGAAEILGVPPSTLQSRMKRLGIARTGA